MIKLRDMESNDKAFLVGSVALPIIVWWYFSGRKKYGTKGMK